MQRPHTLIWLLTYRCNLSCRHCYVARPTSTPEIEGKQALEIVKGAARAGVRHLGLTGGEVFLRKDALAIIENARELGMFVTVVTNGSLLTQALTKELANLGVFIFLSVDGSTLETHQAIRGNGSWKLVTSAVKNMNSSGVKFRTVMALSKLNYQEVGSYVALAKDFGAQGACLIPVMPAGRARWEDLLDPRDMAAILQELDSVAERLCFPCNLWCTPFARLITKSKFISAGFCRASTEIELDPQGNVPLCDILDIVVSSVTGREFLEAWQEQEKHPLVKSLTNPKLNEPCQTCPIGNKCRGGCFARAQLIAGSIYAPDPLCPRVAGLW